MRFNEVNDVIDYRPSQITYKKENQMKVLIADDHTMFVDGIQSILEIENDMQVVGRCYNGKSVIEFIKNEAVDIILLDVNLPDINGVEVCKEVLKINSGIMVLAITMFNEESFIQEILNNGAKGYILKNTGREELLKAVRTVSRGESYFSKEVTESIMKSLMNQRKASNKSIAEIPKISRREKEVLKLIIEEYTTQEIADTLYISLKTVESHRASLLSKLNARNTAGLVRIAIEHKLLEPSNGTN
jgi:DNA-binding NarL/FixJ family response regulator